MTTNTERPTVSVWIVAYNHERFIAQCLESVLMQQVDFTYEIVIGEDCSTDGTRAIIQDFEARYPDIIKPIYHESNVGATCNAYKYCYPKLRGKYIACLEADDFWIDDQKLQLQVDALEKDPQAVLCFTQIKVLTDGENNFEQHWSTKYNRRQNRYDAVDILNTFNIVTCSILFRNVYPILPYDPAKYPTGDVSLSVFLMLKGDAIYIDRPTAAYRLHDAGSYSPVSLEKKNLVFLKLFDQFLKEPQLNEFKKLLKVLYADRAYQALCFEIKKPSPDPVLVDKYYHLALKYANYFNLFYPLKTLMRKALYRVTGKSFGRELQY